MDSINRNQEENNREDLSGSGASKKIKELADKANICFFCTSLNFNGKFSTRPMSVQKADESGVLWFLSANDSNKNKEIESDSKVQLLFKGSDYSDFLNLYGKATISSDKTKIKELWQPILKTWFTEGVDDPRISVIRFEPQEGYYWDTKNGAMVALIKRMAGAAVGKTIDDSIEGTLKV